MPELAYVNGTFQPIHEARIPIEDRGFQFGHGVYEVIVSYDRRLFMPEEHMQRLRTSAKAAGVSYDFERKPLLPIVEEGIARSGFPDAMVYIQLTAGVSPRTHLCPPDLEPSVIMTFKPKPVLADELRRRGARVLTVRDDRWSQCYIKAITLLPNVLAKTEAVRQGCDDAVFVTESGEARECTSANLFIVKDGHVRFPPRNHSVLHGITQRFILQCAEAVGVPMEEAVISVDALRSADEVFMSSTIVEVLGITAIDGAPVGTGRVGLITEKLHEAFVAGVRGKLSASA